MSEFDSCSRSRVVFQPEQTDPRCCRSSDTEICQSNLDSTRTGFGIVDQSDQYRRNRIVRREEELDDTRNQCSLHDRNIACGNLRSSTAELSTQWHSYRMYPSYWFYQRAMEPVDITTEDQPDTECKTIVFILHFSLSLSIDWILEWCYRRWASSLETEHWQEDARNRGMFDLLLYSSYEQWPSQTDLSNM